MCSVLPRWFLLPGFIDQKQNNIFPILCSRTYLVQMMGKKLKTNKRGLFDWWLRRLIRSRVWLKGFASALVPLLFKFLQDYYPCSTKFKRETSNFAEMDNSSQTNGRCSINVHSGKCWRKNKYVLQIGTGGIQLSVIMGVDCLGVSWENSCNQIDHK